MKKLLVSIIFYNIILTAQGQNILVQPYLQNAAPDSVIIMWETDSGTETEVLWGPDSNLGNMATGVAAASQGGAFIHTTALPGLSPATRYYYRAKTGAWTSAIYDFVTPPLQSSEAAFRLVAMSDMQKDNSQPNKFFEVVHSGVLKYAQNAYSGDLPVDIGLVLIPGDLVATGTSWSQWRNDFFAQSHPLFSHVPVYPVLGNHELNASQYFQYFNLPLNGTAGFEEHWWYKDYSNVRVIGMDSNNGYTIQAQLDWLQDILDQTCGDPLIDFVFVQLHHPHKSELWLPGEIDFTGDMIAMMETFSDDCNKPGIHFFGHTHGYSRGQSKDHNHLWVNVATAGGAIDNWGEYPQQDYDEFVISQDEYGFVMAEIYAGEDPRFVLKRLSLGDENNVKDNSLEDMIEIRVNNAQPQTPVPLFPLDGDTVNPACLLLRADDFIDPDLDSIGASQWQVAAGCSGFDDPLVDNWRQHKNWYFEVNTQASDDLRDEEISGLDPDTDYCWRVRYRDRGLKWSEWSEPVSFHTAGSGVTANLVQNPGAEGGITSWTATAGVIESLTVGECAGINPHSGSRYFAVGALCQEFAYAEANQVVDVSAYTAMIDGDTAIVEYGGYLSDWNGQDRPEFRLEFLNELDQVIGNTETTGMQIPAWTLFARTFQVPAQTRKIRFILMGTRNGGTDNDSYFDDMYLRLNFTGAECSEYIAPGPAAGRLYVNEDAPGLPTGESWQKAYLRLENALVAADTLPGVNEIWIAEGVYKPTVSSDRTKSFSSQGGVRLYGGFSGIEHALEERDPQTYLTRLSGDIGVMGNDTDNSLHVIAIDQLSDTLWLDGLNVENGRADLAPDTLGGGMYLAAGMSSPVVLRNCRFIGNAAVYGGAVSNGSLLLAEDVSFEENTALESAAVYFGPATGSLGMFRNCSTAHTCIACPNQLTLLNGAELIIDGVFHLGAED